MFSTFMGVALILILGAFLYWGVGKILVAFKFGDPIRTVILVIIAIGTIILAVMKSGLLPGFG